MSEEVFSKSMTLRVGYSAVRLIASPCLHNRTNETSLFRGTSHPEKNGDWAEYSPHEYLVVLRCVI